MPYYDFLRGIRNEFGILIRSTSNRTFTIMLERFMGAIQFTAIEQISLAKVSSVARVRN